MLKRLDDITNLPFWLIYCVLSWPFSVLIRIKSLLKSADRNGGSVLAARVAERFIKGRNRRRLRIAGATPKGGHFSTTVVTIGSDGSASDDERSYESYESEEEFSDAFDSEVWRTEKDKYPLLGKTTVTRPPMLDDLSFIRHNHRSNLRGRKRNRSPSVLEPIQEDFSRPEGTQGTGYTQSGMHKDHCGIETRSTRSTKNGRPFEIGRPHGFCPEISLWPMGDIEPIHSPSPDGGKTPPKKRGILSLSRLSLRGTSVKSSETSEPPSTPKRRNEQISAVASRLKAMIPKQVLREPKSRTSDHDMQATVLQKLKGMRIRISFHLGDSRPSDINRCTGRQYRPPTDSAKFPLF